MSVIYGQEAVDKVAASLRQPAIQRRKAADLSSVERSALMDELVTQLIEVNRAIRRVDAKIQELDSIDHEQWAQLVVLQSRAGSVESKLSDRTLWQRLRMLVTGK